jgi:hypothetical protein
MRDPERKSAKLKENILTFIDEKSEIDLQEVHIPRQADLTDLP